MTARACMFCGSTELTLRTLKRSEWVECGGCGARLSARPEAEARRFEEMREAAAEEEKEEGKE